MLIKCEYGKIINILAKTVGGFLIYAQKTVVTQLLGALKHRL